MCIHAHVYIYIYIYMYIYIYIYISKPPSLLMPAARSRPSMFCVKWRRSMPLSSGQRFALAIVACVLCC